jgi:hypothetical protein
MLVVGDERSFVGLFNNILALSFAVFLSACSPQTPEQQIETYNNKLGPQGQLTATHLFINWPTNSQNTKLKAVTLKIPREFLNDVPVTKDDHGDLRWVYINFKFPEIKPWKETPRLEMTTADGWSLLTWMHKFDVKNQQPAPPQPSSAGLEAGRAWALNLKKRVLITLDRDSYDGYAGREYARKQGKEAGRYVEDGMQAGLERYSTLRCYTPEQREALNIQEFLRAKPDDDPTPQFCRLDRRDAILVSPPDVVKDNEGVDIHCAPTGCHANFLAGGRGARIELSHENLAHWQERVEAARQLVNRFVVP